MSISFECPQCGKKLKAPDEAAGKSSKCPGCGGKVTCPALSRTASVVPRPAPTTPSPKAPAVDPYGDFDEGNLYALREPDPVEAPTAPAQDESSGPEVKRMKAGKGGKKKKGRAYLRDVAIN